MKLISERESSLVCMVPWKLRMSNWRRPAICTCQEHKHFPDTFRRRWNLSGLVGISCGWAIWPNPIGQQENHLLQVYVSGEWLIPPLTPMRKGWRGTRQSCSEPGSNGYRAGDGPADLLNCVDEMPGGDVSVFPCELGGSRDWLSRCTSSEGFPPAWMRPSIPGDGRAVVHRQRQRSPWPRAAARRVEQGSRSRASLRVPVLPRRHAARPHLQRRWSLRGYRAPIKALAAHVAPLGLAIHCGTNVPIRIHFASACPDAALFRLLAGRLAAAGP